MIEINGKYTSAKIFSDNVEEAALEQITLLCNQKFTQGQKIRIMPDVHWGNGCCVGTTMTLSDKVVSNLVGVDIGCGMFTAKIAEKNLDFAKLDAVIRKDVPSGFNIHTRHQDSFMEKLGVDKLKCRKAINFERASKSLGTLGGGNHFIEVDKDDEGNLYIVVHSGSRNLGKQAAEHYQKLAAEKLNGRVVQNTSSIIDSLKRDGKTSIISSVLQALKLGKEKVAKDLEYLQGSDFEDYIHDMAIIQAYASMNRERMISRIVNGMNLTVVESFQTIHNYIDTKNMIMRKGSVSAQNGEKLLIPINMRDGSLVCIGKGNADWNYSAPHGAGRIMSRSKAKQLLNMDEYRKSMDGIFTKSVSEDTIDEAPMVYKPLDEIVENVKDAVDIIANIKPVYNFKAS